MAIIFLDIDGVLNNTGSLMLNHGKECCTSSRELFMSELENIRKFIPELKVVISSTWRITHSLDDIIEAVNSPNYPSLGEYLHINWRTPRLEGMRGKEIIQWLKDNSIDDKTSYVCIDDDSDFYPHQPLIRTDTYVGFNLYHAIMLRAFFLSPEQLSESDIVILRRFVEDSSQASTRRKYKGILRVIERHRMYGKVNNQTVSDSVSDFENALSNYLDKIDM